MPDTHQIIRKEATAHIELGMLLRKDRDEEQKKEVEKILKSNRSIEEKIRQIKKVDSLDQSRDQAQTIPAAGRVLPLRYRFSMMQSVIKRPYLRQPYFRFLFYHSKNIFRFCRATGALSFVLLPPRIKLNKRMGAFITEVLRPTAKELLRLCDLVLETGWQILTKKEYNLIIILKRQARLISTLNLNQQHYKYRNLIDEIRAIESMFLVLHYRPSFGELIISSMARVLENHSTYNEEIHVVSDLAKELLDTKTLDTKTKGKSLYSLVLGLNMLKYRRFFTLEDLLTSDLGEIVNTTQFACNSQIREKITDHIQKCKNRLLALDMQRDNYKQLTEYLLFDNSGEVDYSLLQYFYENSKGDKKNLSFEEDRDNTVVFAIRFFRAFDDTFFPLLGSKIRLSGVGTVSLFVKEFFRTEFQTIRQVIVDLEKLRFKYRRFPRSRFLKIKRSIEAAIGIESEIIQLINKGIATNRELGKKIEWILSSHITEAEISDEQAPLDLHINEGKPFALPYEDRKIASAGSLDGKTVKEALSSSVNICFLASVHFHDQATMELLEHGGEINDLIDNEMAVIKRIAEPSEYDDVVRMLIY